MADQVGGPDQVLTGDVIDGIALVATPGQLGDALAAYAAYAEIPAIIFLPQGKVSTAQLIQPVANGAHVLALESLVEGGRGGGEGRM